MPRKKAEVREDGALVPLVQTDDRGYDAAMLRASGMPWDQIATTLDFTGANEARVTVNAYVQRAAMQADQAMRQEALDLTMLRLDQLLIMAWQQAEAGDLKAIDTCVRIIAQQAKLWGFEDRSERVTNNTVIVRPEDFAKTFQAHVEGRAS